jgi:hypothetical protein
LSVVGCQYDLSLNTVDRFEFGIWVLFVIWNLGFEVSLVGWWLSSVSLSGVPKTIVEGGKMSYQALASHLVFGVWCL